MAKKFSYYIVFLAPFFVATFAFAAHPENSTNKTDLHLFNPDYITLTSSQLACNFSVKESVTFKDQQYRLLRSISAGGRIEHDDVFALHGRIIDRTTPEGRDVSNIWRFGNCGCSEQGCAGAGDMPWLAIWQDSGFESTDSVTLTGEALEKPTAGAQSARVGFAGPLVKADWTFCLEKHVVSNGQCRAITGSIFSDKTVCGAPCSPRISWNIGSVLTGAGVPENVRVKKNADDSWQTGQNNGQAVDSGLVEGTYTYILYGTASDGNNAAKEFELGRVSVTVRPEPPPDCNDTTATLGVPVILQALEGTPDAGFSWSAPGGNPSTGSGSSFTTTYNATGAQTVTVSSGGQSGTCTVTVNVAQEIKIDIKANNSDGPYV